MLAVAAVCVLRFAFFLVRFLDVPDLPIDPDSLDYIAPARALYETLSFSTLHGTPEFRRAPGYPGLIAASFALFGKDNFLPIVVLQNLLFFGAALIVIYFAHRLGGMAAAVIAACLYLTDFPAFYYTNEVLTDSPFAVLLTTSVLLIYKAFTCDKPSLGWLVLAGVVLTAATYIRPFSLYLFYPFAAAIALLAYRRDAIGTHAVKAGTAFLLPWILLGSLWYARNYATFDQVKFVGQEAELLLDRTSAMIGDIEGVEVAEGRLLYPKYLGSEPITMSTHVRFYLDRPALFAKITALSVVALFAQPAQWHLPFYVPDYPTDRKPLTKLALAGDFSAMAAELGSHGLANNLIFAALIGHIVVLLTGALLAVRFLGGQSPPLQAFVVIVAIVFVYVMMVNGVVGGGARYRLPLSPYLAILAGYGYVRTVARWRTRRAG